MADDERQGGEVQSGRYVFAEHTTGCTLFMPKLTNPERTAAILHKAMEWYGSAPRAEGL